MSKLEIVQSLFEYNEWANERVLEAAALVDEADLLRENNPSFGSIQGILIHILGSHVSWLMKWTGEPPPLARLQPGNVASGLQESFAATHRRLRDHIGSLTEAQVEAVTSLMDPQDGQWRTWQRPAWQMYLSVGSHAMAHRAEAAMLLTELGASPGEIDYSMWAWRRHQD
jgi:uncharacterized damage-inducible protein DinB